MMCLGMCSAPPSSSVPSGHPYRSIRHLRRMIAHGTSQLYDPWSRGCSDAEVMGLSSRVSPPICPYRGGRLLSRCCAHFCRFSILHYRTSYSCEVRRDISSDGKWQVLSETPQCVATTIQVACHLVSGILSPGGPRSPRRPLSATQTMGDK